MYATMLLAVVPLNWEKDPVRKTVEANRARTSGANIARTFVASSLRPAASTPAMFGVKYGSTARHLSVLRWMRIWPAASSSEYTGRYAVRRADRAVERAAWVCVMSKVGSCARSFSSRVASWARSSSSSEDGAAVFCSVQSVLICSRDM